MKGELPVHVRAVPAQNIYPFTNHLAMQALLLPIIFLTAIAASLTICLGRNALTYSAAAMKRQKLKEIGRDYRYFLLGKTALTATNFWCMDWISSG